MPALRLVFPVLLASLAAAGGCGEESLCDENGVTVVIEDNHPSGTHELDIPASDVADAQTQTYDIQGLNTGHGHTVTVTADDFADLDAGDAVTLESSDTGAAGEDHTHGIVLDCDP